ncbi:MAG: histidine kinase [Lewinellaceae bacterium]|nr:histidine kinase [Lewinella sp.]MCB9280474.1 histidine kinase [Lewinellaceae bacterium]
MSRTTGSLIFEKRDTRLLLVVGGLHTLTQTINLIRTMILAPMENRPLNWGMIIQDRITSWLIGLLFAFLIILTTKRLLNARISWPRIMAIHVLTAFVVSIIWFATFIGISMLIYSKEDMGDEEWHFWIWLVGNFDKLFLMYLITVCITYTYYYVQRDNDNQVQQSTMKSQLLQTRLKMLQSQLHPHFLFNTLNSIVSLIDTDIKKAKSMIADLGDLLRRVLDNRDVQLVPLREELEITRKYLDIEKTRFSDDLTVEWEQEGQLADADIPGMLLQPLAENSIRHGFSRSHPSLFLRIIVQRAGNRLKILVSDNGQGIPESEVGQIFAKGAGLSNTYERLKTVYGDDFIFEVENTHPGVRNFIDIPARGKG